MTHSAFSSVDLKRILSSLPTDLRSTLSCPPIIQSITSLTGGLTNTNFLFAISKADGESLKLVVRRISESSTRSLNIDRLSEISNSDLAYNWGLAPRLISVVHHREDRNDDEEIRVEQQRRPEYIISNYVQGTTLNNQDVQKMCQDPIAVGSIVEVLTGLHRGGERPERTNFENRFNIVKVRSKYLEVCKKENWELPPGYRELEVALQEVIFIIDPDSSEAQTRLSDPLASSISTLALSSREALVPCHNDLLAANMILTARDRRPSSISDGVESSQDRHQEQEQEARNQIKLIDFEYSGLNYPSFDLGNLYSECELSEDQLSNLVRAYWEKSSSSGLRSRSRSQSEQQDQDHDHDLSNSESTSEEASGFIKSKIARAKLWAGVAQMSWVAWATIQANSVSISVSSASMPMPDPGFTSEVSNQEGETTLTEEQTEGRVREGKAATASTTATLATTRTATTTATTTAAEQEKRLEYLDWREVKMRNAKRLLGEEGRAERMKLINECLQRV